LVDGDWGDYVEKCIGFGPLGDLTSQTGEKRCNPKPCHVIPFDPRKLIKADGSLKPLVELDGKPVRWARFDDGFNG
jgi:hypothetical protein